MFASLFFVNGVYAGQAAVTEHMTPLNKTLYRAGCFLLYGFMLACVLATIVVGLTNTFQDHLYGGNTWAQIMAVSWLNSLIWSFGHACVAATLGPHVIPFFFGFLLVSSVLGGWSTDLADIGYKQFYQIFPFLWSNNIVKNSLYGALPTYVGLSAGILLVEAAFFIMLFFYFSLFRGHSHTPAAKDNEEPASQPAGEGNYELVQPTAEEAAIVAMESENIHEIV